MLHTVVSYLRLGLPIVYMIGTWRFADWRNWEKYYPTILFIIAVDFFITVLMSEYPLWTFQGSLIVPNHTIADFMLTFITFPNLTLLYLSLYPYQSHWPKQVLYIGIWFIIEVITEYLFLSAKLISYTHGWNFGWSCLVWLFMFIGLRLHHARPLWAWVLCFMCSAFLILYFHIPVTKFR
ncbi:CBO0543 family protein [Bacillus sp. UNC41MFS5]|uniref:CBO0543 family protein n=1 Tax=Bacillus sp. UNC41MFS5 TaxID=1449046 RepID=UPI00068EB0A0|nr:CBO0543 family protein [Bacillus sp. UNC41MFS5]